jgi:hypothetical protein
MGPKAGLDMIMKRKIPAAAGEPLIIQPIVQHYTNELSLRGLLQTAILKIWE